MRWAVGLTPDGQQQRLKPPADAIAAARSPPLRHGESVAVEAFVVFTPWSFVSFVKGFGVWRTRTTRPRLCRPFG